MHLLAGRPHAVNEGTVRIHDYLAGARPKVISSSLLSPQLAALGCVIVAGRDDSV